MFGEGLKYSRDASRLVARCKHSALVNLALGGVQVGKKQCHYKWPKAMQIKKCLRMLNLQQMSECLSTKP